MLEHGEPAYRPLRNAEATDRYTLRGGGPETYEPTFTFHGFRYVEVDGWPGELDPGDFVAVVLHSDMERTGTFTCDNELLEPAPLERRVGHARQLPRRADRLPPA